MLTRNTTRLALNRDTVRVLTGLDLRGVQGGAVPVSKSDETGTCCWTNNPTICELKSMVTDC